MMITGSSPFFEQKFSLFIDSKAAFSLVLCRIPPIRNDNRVTISNYDGEGRPTFVLLVFSVLISF